MDKNEIEIYEFETRSNLSNDDIISAQILPKGQVWKRLWRIKQARSWGLRRGVRTDTNIS